jgi:hypothetical protein
VTATLKIAFDSSVASKPAGWQPASQTLTASFSLPFVINSVIISAGALSRFGNFREVKAHQFDNIGTVQSEKNNNFSDETSLISRVGNFGKLPESDSVARKRTPRPWPIFLPFSESAIFFKIERRSKTADI